MLRRIMGRANRRIAMALWRRDGGICGRCTRPINPYLHGYLPLALTIGHIIPRALGGSDGWDNLRAEHRVCNLAAGAAVDVRARYVEP